jgi:hypothetical protein
MMFHDLRAPNRIAPTSTQRINPLWWLGDAHRPASKGVVGWFFRNPCANLFAVIIGITHRTRLVAYARGDGYTYAEAGWNWGWSVPFRGWLPRPFISWRGERIELAIGWKTSGAFTPTSTR